AQGRLEEGLYLHDQKNLFIMTHNFLNFGEMNLTTHRTQRSRFLSRSLKWLVLIWMLCKVDVGRGQIVAPDLISNPDITVDPDCDIGWVSFFEGCVDSWQCTNGTPHHVRWNVNQCFDNFNGAGRVTNCLYSLNDGTAVWNEAIFQPVNIIRNNFITYDLAVSLNLLRC